MAKVRNPLIATLGAADLRVSSEASRASAAARRCSRVMSSASTGLLLTASASVPRASGSLRMNLCRPFHLLSLLAAQGLRQTLVKHQNDINRKYDKRLT